MNISFVNQVAFISGAADGLKDAGKVCGKIAGRSRCERLKCALVQCNYGVN